MYVITALLGSLVAALVGGLVSVLDGEGGTTAIKAGAQTFARALTLLIIVRAALGVVGS
ncbi:hypothetical protein ACHZ98_31835 [Streptomyces sp. MAR4 CNY-716]